MYPLIEICTTFLYEVKKKYEPGLHQKMIRGVRISRRHSRKQLPGDIVQQSALIEPEDGLSADEIMIQDASHYGAELRSGAAFCSAARRVHRAAPRGAGFLKSVAPRKSKIFKNHLSGSDMSDFSDDFEVISDIE